MAPQSSHPLFSPSELAYLHTSLSLHPPIRPDGRSPTTFRPLNAETDLVDSANGSARLVYADGTEAIVGVKSEVQRSSVAQDAAAAAPPAAGEMGADEQAKTKSMKGELQSVREAGQKGETLRTATDGSWVEVTLDMSGAKDDDTAVVSLTQTIHEGLVADGALQRRLRINRRWHWKLYIDILLLLSPPHTYPLPLLSLTTHLALLTTRLPALVSSTGSGGGGRGEEGEEEEEEDPLFNDDWDAAVSLYDHSSAGNDKGDGAGDGATGRGIAPVSVSKPPIALLVAVVGENIFFDPSGEELAVADAVVAVTVAGGAGSETKEGGTGFEEERRRRRRRREEVGGGDGGGDAERGGEGEGEGEGIKVVAVRMVDPPARLSSATDGGEEEAAEASGVWRPRRGGVSRKLLKRMVGMCVERGGVGEEVLRGLSGFL